MHGSLEKKTLTEEHAQHSDFSCTDTWEDFFFFIFPHLASTITAFLSKEWLNADSKINFRTDALIPFGLRNARALCNPSQGCCGPPPGEEVTLQLLETTAASISLLINMGSANNTHNQWKRSLFFIRRIHQGPWSTHLFLLSSLEVFLHPGKLGISCSSDTYNQDCCFPNEVVWQHVLALRQNIFALCKMTHAVTVQPRSDVYQHYMLALYY